MKSRQKKTRLSERPMFETVTSVLYPLLFGAVIFVLWETELLHRMIGTTESILPTPSHIADIIAGNLKGAVSVLVEPFHMESAWTFKLKRKAESLFFHRDYSKLRSEENK